MLSKPSVFHIFVPGVYTYIKSRLKHKKRPEGEVREVVLKVGVKHEKKAQFEKARPGIKFEVKCSHSW